METGIDHCVRAWIVSLLRSRVIHAELGYQSRAVYAVRGTPQGGVLSPLLWLMVLNKLLVMLDS